jgi:hypothetical protein
VGLSQQHSSQEGICRGAALLWKRANLLPWCVRSSNSCVCLGAALLCHCDSLVLCGACLSRQWCITKSAVSIRAGHEMVQQAQPRVMHAHDCFVDCLLQCVSMVVLALCSLSSLFELLKFQKATMRSIPGQHVAESGGTVLTK